MLSNALVIDDDLDVQLLGKMLLTQQGYDVVTAGSLGELARKPALLNAELILLDLGLGEFTGLDIVDYLYDLRLKASILIISSCTQETADIALSKGKTMGFHMLGFLPKSKLLTDLIAILEPLKNVPKPPTKDDLARAIAENQLFLAYQPQIDLQKGHVTGVEALVRWQDPERGVLYPDSFIPLAEQNGLMLPLTRCVIEHAMKQQALWQSLGWNLNVSINIPVAFIQAEGVMEEFDQLTLQSGATLANITLELTESVGVEGLGYASSVLKSMRQRGCQLALDDFGTGYSSLTYLKKMPVHSLKIDKQFIRDLLVNEEDTRIANIIIDLGRSLNLKVIAEGVETAEQEAYLTRRGCDIGQGYFFSKPVPPRDFESFLKTFHRNIVENNT